MKEKKSSKIKEELDRRGISVEDLRQFEAYGTATIFKEDLDIDEIVEWILSGRINYSLNNDVAGILNLLENHKKHYLTK